MKLYLLKNRNLYQFSRWLLMTRVATLNIQNIKIYKSKVKETINTTAHLISTHLIVQYLSTFC
jgi:hypothetical protein